ncbi:response regulator, partial [Acinetobacter baumannii]
MIYDFMTTIAQTISKPLILAVEDEPSSLMILRATLEKAGFEVITAVNGQEALDRFTADHPELILLDVSMPI